MPTIMAATGMTMPVMAPAESLVPPSFFEGEGEDVDPLEEAAVVGENTSTSLVVSAA